VSSIVLAVTALTRQLMNHYPNLIFILSAHSLPREKKQAILATDTPASERCIRADYCCIRADYY
jgi:hypothetical protein